MVDPARHTAVPAERRTPGPIARRVGYTLAITINLVLVYLVNGWPGWRALPVLTGAFEQVLGLINASFAFGVGMNVALLVVDRRVVKAALDVVSSVVGLAVAIALWRVFPFDFGAFENGGLLARVVLGFVIAATAIALVAQLIVLVTVLVRWSRAAEDRPIDE